MRLERSSSIDRSVQVEEPKLHGVVSPEATPQADDFARVHATGRHAQQAKPAQHPSLWGALQLLKDGAVEGLGRSVGYMALLGFRYPVKHYQWDMTTGVITRGSRLNDDELHDLYARGFNGIVSLCAEGDSDPARAAGLGMTALNVAVIDNHAPSFEQVKAFLDFTNDPKNQPVYFHCQMGKGRTGVMAACYRMAVEGWSLENALAEAFKFGLTMPGQIEFVRDFPAALAAGKVPGYPLLKSR